MLFNLWDIIILVSLSQGIVFGLVVLSGRLFKGSTNKHFGISVILISIIGIERWLNMWDFDKRYYFIDFFGDDVPWILLFFVPIFIYLLKSVGHPLSSSRKLWYLTIPFIIFLLLNIIIDLDIDFGWINAPFFVRNMYVIYKVEGYLAFTFNTILCGLSYFVIVRSQTTNIKWLKNVWFFTLFLNLAWFFLVYPPKTLLSTNKTIAYQLWIMVSFFIYFLIYRGMYRLNLVQNRAAINELLKHSQISNTNFIEKESNTVSSKKVLSGQEYIIKLKKIMESEHLYRNPDLEMETVANKIGISVSYLSQHINSLLKVNFTGFINSYRISEAKSMLLDPEFKHYSILSIGLEAGFKSKSAFYSVFKKETGLTPNQFKREKKKS